MSVAYAAKGRHAAMHVFACDCFEVTEFGPVGH